MNKAVIVIIVLVVIGAVIFFSQKLSSNFSIERQTDKAVDYFNAKVSKIKGDLVDTTKGKIEQLWDDNATSFVDSARQKTADKVQDLATVISGNSSSSSTLEAEYNKAKADYLQKIADLGGRKDLETEFSNLEKIMTKSLEALKKECGI